MSNNTKPMSFKKGVKYMSQGPQINCQIKKIKKI